MSVWAIGITSASALYFIVIGQLLWRANAWHQGVQPIPSVLIPGRPVLDTDLQLPPADFENLIAEPLLKSTFEPHPWHSWKTTLGGKQRLVRFDGLQLLTVPGASSGAVHLFDDDRELGNWSFSTGWRIDLIGASFKPAPELSTNVLEVQTKPETKGRNIARQYFAFSGDRLRFIRMEDDAGVLQQNNYRAPNHTLGIVPEAKQREEWVALLKTGDRVDILAALTFIGGEHGWFHEESEQANMARTLQRDPEIQGLMVNLRTDENAWVREAAEMAAMEASWHSRK